MNEAKITADLVTYLTPLNRGEITKLSDQSTIGIPDMAVVGGHTTMWVEVKYEKYLKPHPFNLRKLLGWPGPQFRFVAKSDYHGSGSFYIIFFHQTRLRRWNTMIFTGVQAANWCNADENIYLDRTSSFPIYEGKAFHILWEEIQKRRKTCINPMKTF